MTEAPRRTHPLPFLAIFLLVGLLSAFVIIRFTKKAPAVVKTPPPVEVKKDPEIIPKPPSEPLPAPVPPPAGEKEFERFVAEAKKAMGEKKWDAASDAVASARKIKADPELEELARQIAAGRELDAKAAAAAAEARRTREERWAAVREEVVRLQEKNLWDAATKALADLAKEHPSILEEKDYKEAAENLHELHKDAANAFRDAMKKAEKLAGEGNLTAALESAANARILYPERADEVARFRDGLTKPDDARNMVKIHEKDSWVGSDDVEDEKPLRKVRLKPFLMDTFEVTNDEYLAFILATGHAPPPPPFWPATGKPPPVLLKHPVVGVTAADAAAYAAWRGKRLPTAEEWEVAARGPTKWTYPWGDSFSDKENVYHCNCLEYWQVERKVARGTLPVDFPAFNQANVLSPWGVSGMAGNVWEWTASSRKVGDGVAEFRILKGGSFMTPSRAIRSANFLLEDPELRFPDVGFRCVRDVP